MIENYIDLLAAVYRQAVKDDCATVKARVRTKLKEQGLSSEETFEYIESKGERIKDIVRKNISRECKEWGDEQLTRRIRRDYIKDLVNSIVAEVE